MRFVMILLRYAIARDTLTVTNILVCMHTTSSAHAIESLSLFTIAHDCRCRCYAHVYYFTRACIHTFVFLHCIYTSIICKWRSSDWCIYICVHKCMLCLVGLLHSFHLRREEDASAVAAAANAINDLRRHRAMIVYWKENLHIYYTTFSHANAHISEESLSLSLSATALSALRHTTYRARQCCLCCDVRRLNMNRAAASSSQTTACSRSNRRRHGRSNGRRWRRRRRRPWHAARALAR